MSLILSAALLASASLSAGPLSGSGERPPSEGGGPLAAVRFETRRATLNANLLGAAAQARLKRLEWTFGRWGLAEKKKEARAAFTRVSGALLRFREAGEAAEPLGDPDAALGAALRESPQVLAAARGVPDSAAERVAEVLRLREGYDAEASREALARSIASGGRTGGYPFAAQAEAMRLLRALQADIAAAAKSLSPSPKAADKSGARDMAEADLKGLAQDASFLTTEIGLLDIRFRLPAGGKGS